MTDQAYIFELTASSFEQSAVQNSHRIPVLVEFMGVWSGPCIAMSDRLAVLATELAGQFVFARIDIDEQQELRQQFRIEKVPTLVVLHKGQEQRREVGELSEAELRALLKEFGVFRFSDEQREQARLAHLQGQTPQAILLLTEAIKSDPGNIRIVLDMVQIFIDIGELEQARSLFERLPEQQRQQETGQSLASQLKFAELAARTAGPEALHEKLRHDPEDHPARFDLAICLVAAHDIDAAMQQLFNIVICDADFREGAARELIGLLANMLSGSDPEAASAYRRRLANLLASD